MSTRLSTEELDVARIRAAQEKMREVTFGAWWLGAADILATADAISEPAARRALRDLTDALDRTERNFRLAVNGRPVRDMAENLAENERARESARRADQ